YRPEASLSVADAMCSCGPSLVELAGDVVTQDVGPEPRLRHCRVPVPAPEVQDLESVGDAKRLDQRLTTLSHALRDASEVALLPKRFVRIHWRSGHPPTYSRPNGRELLKVVAPVEILDQPRVGRIPTQPLACQRARG